MNEIRMGFPIATLKLTEIRIYENVMLNTRFEISNIFNIYIWMVWKKNEDNYWKTNLKKNKKLKNEFWNRTSTGSYPVNG